MKSLKSRIDTRFGFFILISVLFWLKTLFAYFTDISLGVSGIFQWIILLINPIATTMLIFGLALYVRPKRAFYWTAMLLDLANTVLLYLNVIYFREFSDFMTVNTMLGYSKVNQGLSASSMSLTNFHDIFYWLDLLVIFLLLVLKKLRWIPTRYRKNSVFKLLR